VLSALRVALYDYARRAVKDDDGEAEYSIGPKTRR
jgi:hypothetical protein